MTSYIGILVPHENGPMEFADFVANRPRDGNNIPRAGDGAVLASSGE